MGGASETATADSAGDSVATDQPRDRDASGRHLVEVGDCLGRYTIRRLLGRGAMGEVYAAHDPQLDRSVAIKVLQSGSGSPQARLRFQREAQAMAQLNHPNVVAVHDVGTIGDHTFVAMELVEGPTLADWLAQPRSIREIVDVFEQAGRGLAAAHAAGITHRDFKPSNVMLGDRVRVVDFGLARRSEDDEVLPVERSTVLDEQVTQTGGVLGTRAYMAPEQYERAEWSPASDQYSFGVSLREAVTGARHSTQSPTRPMPTWLRPLIDRATEPDPDERFPSMDALLAQLARSPYRRRRLAIVIAGAALIAGGSVAAIAWPSNAVESCERAEGTMVGVWDADRKAAVRAAFAATKQPYAEITWTRASAALDRYRDAWLDAQVQTCRATVEGRQSAALLDIKMSCLERRRSLMRELVQLWLDGTDLTMLGAAGDAVASLPAIDECIDDEAALERVPLPQASVAVARIAAVRGGLDLVRALALAGRYKEAEPLVAPLVRAADETGWVQVRAEAKYLQGRIARELGVPETEPLLVAANQLASDARDDHLAAQSLVDLVEYLAVSAQSSERALLVASLADAAVTRAGNDARQRVLLLRYRGDAHQAAAKFDEAKTAFTQCRELAARSFGADRREELLCLSRLAGVESSAGDNEASRKHAEESLAGLVELVGPGHPAVSAMLNELGAIAYNVDDYDRAADYMSRALAIEEATAGPESLRVAMMLMNLGAVETFRGQLEPAEKMLLRALAIRERVQGRDHPNVARVLDLLVNVYHLRGEYDRELEINQRSLAITTKAYGPDDPRVAVQLEGIALSLQGRGHHAEALTYHQRALDLRREKLGHTHLLTLTSMVQLAAVQRVLRKCREARALMALAIPAFEQAGASAANALEVRGECELADGAFEQAATTAAAAITACGRTSATNPECATKHWLLARALEKGGKRVDALAAATIAEQRMSATNGAYAKELDEVRAWIATRRR